MEKISSNFNLHYGARAGWVKHKDNPVLGSQHGTCFDISVLAENGIYKMWFSWRTKQCIALVESQDGVHWSEPKIVLEARKGSDWEGHEVNRPVVIKTQQGYKMWYTGQMMPAVDGGTSAIGYAESDDGITWRRVREEPVLCAEQNWEKAVLMSSHVIWDEAEKTYKMWYCGGEQIEPDSIGYATSADGINWTKHPANPIFTADPKSDWESFKVGGPFVMKHEGWYLMFYIGYIEYPAPGRMRSHIGIARSRDGITGWERHPFNPIISPEDMTWDAYSCYKPYVVYEKGKWTLWYNGGSGEGEWLEVQWLEQVGVAYHESEDLGFFTS